MWYATLEDLKQNYKDITDTADDAMLIMALDWATKLWDFWKQRRYDVVYETRYFDYPGRAYDRPFGVFSTFDSMATPAEEAALRFNDDLLAVETLTNGDGTAIASTDYVLGPYELPLKRWIRLKPGSGVTWQRDANYNPYRVIAITGWWGAHDDYSRAWIDSGNTLGDDVTSGSPALPVGDTNGLASDKRSPRFQTGQMLRLSSGSQVELVNVLAVDSSGSRVSVSRGVNGSTAANWAENTKIEIYRPPNVVAQCALRLAAWRYSQKDADAWDKTYNLGTGVVSVPSALPADVKLLLGNPGRPGIR